MMRFIQRAYRAKRRMKSRKKSFTHSPTQRKTHLRKSYWKISIPYYVHRRLALSSSIFFASYIERKQRNTKFISPRIWEAAAAAGGSRENRRIFLLLTANFHRLFSSSSGGSGKIIEKYDFLFGNPFTRKFTWAFLAFTSRTAGLAVSLSRKAGLAAITYVFTRS